MDARGLELLCQVAPFVTWSTDAALRIRDAGGAACGESMDPPQMIGVAVGQLASDPATQLELLDAHRLALSGTTATKRICIAGRFLDLRVVPACGDGGKVDGCLAIAVDVTQQHAIEESLRQSESSFAAAERLAHIGHWAWDIASNRVSWSDELHRIYQLPREQFGGTYEAFLDRVVPAEREATRATVGDAYRKMQPFAYDHHIARPDGEVRMLRTRGDVIADAQGRAARMVGACWDITDQTRATEQLLRSLSLLRATLESTADGLLITDTAGQVVAFNQRVLELWQIDAEALEGQIFARVLEAVHGQLENAEECTRRVQLYAMHPEMEGKDTLRFKDGRVFERYSRPQRLDSTCVGRVWSYRDVSQRERLLQRRSFLSDASRLLASLDVHKALAGVARLAVAEMCAACAIDLVEHNQLRRVLSLSRDQIEPPRFTEAARPEAVVYSSADLSSVRVPLTTHGALLGIMHFTAAPGRTYDATDLSLAEELARRVELALENARLFHDLERALAARDEFLAITAHELRGPLTSLRLAVQALQRATAPNATAQLLGVVEREERRLVRFVDELLDVTRIRGGKLGFVLAPCDLVELTRQVAARMSAEASRSTPPLTVSAPARLVGLWDASRLEQVITNLLSNAIKFGADKPIEIRVEGDETTARLIIEDHGIGIAPEAQERIFAAFERDVSSRNYGGLGLGLYIVHTIVDGMRGTVSVTSELGRGARFTVALPIESAR
jgi:PAS domain S-box-containing protein